MQSAGSTDVQSAVQPVAARRRVLIVEDAEPTRRRIAAICLAQGYDVTEATDGLKALKAVSASRYDAILLDLVMPNVDGWQFRETQLRHPELASIPTVIVTIHPLREPDRYALRTPNIIRKPFDDDELIKTLERALAMKPAAAPARETRSSAPQADRQLFWSRRGEIACAAHAPVADSDRWRSEQWAPISATATYQQIVYQCQHCPGHKGPIQRKNR